MHRSRTLALAHGSRKRLPQTHGARTRLSHTALVSCPCTQLPCAIFANRFRTFIAVAHRSRTALVRRFCTRPSHTALAHGLRTRASHTHTTLAHGSRTYMPGAHARRPDTALAPRFANCPYTYTESFRARYVYSHTAPAHRCRTSPTHRSRALFSHPALAYQHRTPTSHTALAHGPRTRLSHTALAHGRLSRITFERYCRRAHCFGRPLSARC